MSHVINLSSLNGSPPFSVYVCDITITYCYFIQDVISGPFLFEVPNPLESVTSLIVKIVDNNGCEEIQYFEC